MVGLEGLANRSDKHDYAVGKAVVPHIVWPMILVRGNIFWSFFKKKVVLGVTTGPIA